MIRSFESLEEVVTEIRPFFSKLKLGPTPYTKEAGVPVKLPEISPLWKIDEKACMDTLRYIFEISHQCYLVVIHESNPLMYKLMPPLKPIYRKAIAQAVQNLGKNPHLTDGQRAKIQKMAPGRIMQCVVKRYTKPEDLDTNEFLEVFTKLNLSDGMFILNLTDAVIVRKDQTFPFHMVVGNQPLKHPPTILPVLSMSGQRGYMDIPIPNYDDIAIVYAQEGKDLYANFVTDWDKKPNPKAVFRGGPTGCGYTTETNMRLKLMELAATPEYEKRIDIGISGKGNTIDTESVRFDPIHGIGMLNTGMKPTDKFLTMADQSQYAFILHVDGNVNAYRLLYTMTTGSVILRVMSEYTSWAEQYMIPNEHYIEVEKDLSNLALKMDWCLKNPRKCKEISERAQLLARTLLSREFMDAYFTMVFSTFSGQSVERDFQEYHQTRKKLRIEPMSEEVNPRPGRIAILVPHRNRIESLKKLIARFETASLDGNTVDLYVLDQNNGDKFNKGLMLNIGFYLASKRGYDRYLFHDVENLPDDDMLKHYFETLEVSVHYDVNHPDKIGGVDGFTEADYVAINGFPNTIAGKGGENEILYNRLAEKSIVLYRPTSGTYEIESVKRDDLNTRAIEDILQDRGKSATNGLRQIPRLLIQVAAFTQSDFISSYQPDKPNPMTPVPLSQFKMPNEKKPFQVFAFKIQYDLQEKPMPVVNVPEVKVLTEDPLYLPSLKHESLAVPFEHAGRGMESYFTSYAQEHLEGRCWKEGFVRPGSSKVVSYSAGRLQGTTIEYNVLYQVQVFYPYEHMEFECMVRQINKIGIRATVREKQNPVVAYVTREHNSELDFSAYKQGQLIRVKVLGYRFEPGDPTIAVLAEIIPPLESVSSVPPRNLALA